MIFFRLPSCKPGETKKVEDNKILSTKSIAFQEAGLKIAVSKSELLQKYWQNSGNLSRKNHFLKCKTAILTLPMYNIFGPPHQRNSGIQFKCQFWPLTRGGKIDRDCNLIKLGQYLQFFYKLGKNKPAMLNLDKRR